MTPEFKTDRSSVKTRKAIRTALMELLKTKPLGKISIKEITDVANFSRNTFYTHYIDIYDVVEDIADQYTEAFTGSAAKLSVERMLGDTDGCARELLACINKDTYIYDFAFKPEHIHFFELFRKKMIISCIKRYYKETKQPKEIEANVVLPGIVSAIMYSVKDWYNSGRNTARLNEILYTFAMLIKNALGYL